MRRFALLLSLFGMIAGVGCRHVAGKCDCYHDPSNGEIGGGGQPYQSLGAPMGGLAVPEKLGQPDKAK